MSTNKKNKYLRTEIILISLLWLVLIASPILFRDNNESFAWFKTLKSMESLVPIMIVFLINRFFLVPRFFLKKKRSIYFLLVGSLVIFMTTASWFYHIQTNRLSEFRPPLAGQNRKAPAINHPNFQPPFSGPKPQSMPPYANVFILSILIIGFDTGLKTSLRGFELEKEKEILEKENVSNQLDMLRHQVSPHFFMNTLNNIHTLIDISSDDAKEAVIKLSKMMRYLLYETAEGRTSIAKEIEFINSYIELMKLRVSEKVEIVVNISRQIPDKKIPTLLFTSFIENAFKHGISYRHPSYIHIDLIIVSDRLTMLIKNSKIPKGEQKTETTKGIGLENARKRLDLLYGTHYLLDILDAENIFSVNLSIPLQS